MCAVTVRIGIAFLGLSGVSFLQGNLKTLPDNGANLPTEVIEKFQWPKEIMFPILCVAGFTKWKTNSRVITFVGRHFRVTVGEFSESRVRRRRDGALLLFPTVAGAGRAA